MPKITDLLIHGIACLCIINTDAKVSKYKSGVCVYFEEVFQSQIGGEYAICVAFICGNSECNEYGSKLYIIMCITGEWFGLIAVLYPLWYSEPSITTSLYERAIFNSSGRVTEHRKSSLPQWPESVIPVINAQWRVMDILLCQLAHKNNEYVKLASITIKDVVRLWFATILSIVSRALLLFRLAYDSSRVFRNPPGASQEGKPHGLFNRTVNGMCIWWDKIISLVQGYIAVK